MSDHVHQGFIQSEEMFQHALSIDYKFRSGNSVPIQKAWITAEEWRPVYQYIAQQQVIHNVVKDLHTFGGVEIKSPIEEARANGVSVPTAIEWKSATPLLTETVIAMLEKGGVAPSDSTALALAIFQQVENNQGNLAGSLVIGPSTDEGTVPYFFNREEAFGTLDEGVYAMFAIKL